MNYDFTLKINVVDDDQFFSGVIKNQLENLDNIDVSIYHSGIEFLDSLKDNPELVVIDYDLPETNGIQLLEQVKRVNADTICIILSGQKEMSIVVDAYRKNADRYIIKNENALIELIQNVKEHQKKLKIKKELSNLKDLLIDNHKYSRIIGESSVMKEMFGLMSKVENIIIPVLITGQNGTGKELVAKALHYNSARNKRSYIPVNVAAIPDDLIESELFGSEKGAYTGAIKRPGKFEEANGGTIFLDEIGDMPLSLQAKLLRVLQENTVTRLGSSKQVKLDVKILSATNKDLWQEVQAGRFREDLYFRLQGFIIELPLLKDRGNDIILIAQEFVKSFCEKQGLPRKSFDNDAILAMMDYSWPGNIRELKSMVERAVLICETESIKSEDLVFLVRA